MNMIDKNRAAWTEACDARMAQLAPRPVAKPRLRISDALIAVAAVLLGAGMCVALLVLAFTPEVLM